ASALNHPNILTIYEFGQCEDLHFIVTEFIKGETLRQIISQKKLTLREAVEIAIQIGNSLVAAHRAGIIHRDIKPENIMILPDGYVKVLDFGLAKLNGTEEIASEIQQQPQQQQQSTVSLLQTKPGLIVGTVSYMSPEQLRGKKVDGRADLWSLGIVLFEMIAARRPFTGESASDVIAAVLERPLPSLSDISSAGAASVPPELENIIIRALAKNKEERYESVKDFVDDLRSFKEEFLSGMLPQPTLQKTKIPFKQRVAVSASSGESLDNLNSHKTKKVLLGFAIIAALVFMGFGGWFYLQSLFKQTPPKQRKSKPFPISGNVLNAVLSPNGQFIVYIQDDNGRQSLRLRQVAENADSVLVEGEPETFYTGIQFSPDSNSIFYTVFKDSPTGQLYRKPILGGTSSKIVDDVDSTVSFSPDGKQFAFIRTGSHEGIDQIVISDINGIRLRTLSERREPKRYSISVREGLAWSPDGKTIASAAGMLDASGERMTVVEIDVATGAEKEITSKEWFRVGKVLWAKDGQDLIITAAEFGSPLYHILRLTRSTGQIEQITGELNDYLNISLSADSRLLLAIADEKFCNLYIAAANNPNRATQVAGGHLEGIAGLTWTPDGKILYVSMESGNRDIWIIDEDGQNRRQLTTNKASDEYPSISGDGNHIAFISSLTGVPHIWRMNSDGSELKQLTDKGGEAFPQIAPNGNFVFYSAKPLKIWKVSTKGAEPIQVTETPANWIAVSPDNSKIAGLTMSPGQPMRLSIFSAENGKLIKTFDLVGEAGTPNFPPMLRWTPDGEGIAYISTENGVSNIIVQSLNERTPKKITEFATDRIFAFDFSKDGSKIAFARGRARNQLLLFEEF
ncbi:MAG: protein kinase, partial [Acidobacteriota bacterium]|nr:protein kinase [Acidobacteriota bacterium]